MKENNLVTKTSTYEFSVDELKDILTEYLQVGKSNKITDIRLDYNTKEDYSAWSGMPWDDGPLPEIFTGITLTIVRKV